MADQNIRENNNRKRDKKASPRALGYHKIQKRPPHKYETNNCTFYVSTKSSVKAYLEKCSKLILDKEEKEIVIYCLGAAIQKGILLALQICENHPDYQNEVDTLTTRLTDDLEPITEDASYEVQRRKNSGLRIRVFRTDLLKAEATAAASV